MKSVRIGAGLGFYGDSWRPVRASIESGGVQNIASGAARSLRVDNLGKTIAAALLRMEIEAPAALPRLTRQ
jgi:hypothetical protein